MVTSYKTLTGALSLISLKERPLSFSEYASHVGRVLLIYPGDKYDFSAVMLSSEGSVLNAPLECSLALDRYFQRRGIPRDALSVEYCGEILDVPFSRSKSPLEAVYSIKCKQFLSNPVMLSGGMQHTLYTEIGKNRCRIVRAPNETDFSMEILRRMTVIDGLPDAVRAIAYREIGGEVRMASTDATVTLDSIIPLASHLVCMGRCGVTEIICRGVTYRFDLSAEDRTVSLLAADFFFDTT